MAQGDPQGWKSQGADNPTLYDATFTGYKVGESGATGRPLLVTTNRTSGNYDVYEKTLFGNKLLYQYNASTDQIIPNQSNITNYRLYFEGPRAQQKINLNRGVKAATLTLAQNNVVGGQNSISRRELNELEQKSGYRSSANAVPVINAPIGDQQGGYSEPPSDLGSFDVPPLGGNVKLEGISPAATPTAASAVAAPAGPPPVLRYPLANLETARELGISYDYIKIRIVDYIGSLSKDWFESRGLNADTFYLTPEGTNATVSDIYLSNQRTLGYVILPMQPNISSTNSTDWGSDSANILQLVAGGLLNSYFSSVGNKGTINTIRDAFTKAAQSAGVISDVAVDNKSSIAALLAGYIANTSFIQRATGTVINPNMEMLFNGPRLRSFNFTFDMVPRFREEAETVRKIIKTFKKYMAPEKTAGNAFLKAPKIFLLDYIYNGDIDQSEIDAQWSKNSKQHPYLNKIKPCALTDFSVNYTPAGSYMTYGDGGSMTSYQINMTFSEIEPVYQDDIDINSNDMGY